MCFVLNNANYEKTFTDFWTMTLCFIPLNERTPIDLQQWSTTSSLVLLSVFEPQVIVVAPRVCIVLDVNCNLTCAWRDTTTRQSASVMPNRKQKLVGLGSKKSNFRFRFRFRFCSLWPFPLNAWSLINLTWLGFLCNELWLREWQLLCWRHCISDLKRTGQWRPGQRPGHM